MEFIYLWVRDHHLFGDNSFTFNGKFIVTQKLDEDNKSIDLEINENLNFPSNFFGDKIVNISCIIGKNGSGKTKALELLIYILSSNDLWYSIPDYILIKHDPDKKNLFVEHNLYEESTSVFSHQMRRGNEKYKFNYTVPNGYNTTGEWHGSKSQVVYYAPFLDLKNFPIKTNNEDYVDVSTDSLIIMDKEFTPQEDDVLTIHRYKNIERQFEFIQKFQNNLNISEYFPVPDELKICSIEPRYNDHWNHNLSYSAQLIRAYFIGDSTSKNIGIVRKKIDKLLDQLYLLENNSKVNSEEYSSALLEKVRMFFLRDFIDHFFTSWNSDNHWTKDEIGVKIEELEGLDEWEAFNFFLQMQIWTLDNGSASLKLLNNLDDFLRKGNVRIEKSYRDRIVISNNQSKVLTLLNAQVEYLKSLPAWQGLSSVPDLIQIDWRNLSSGEKAFLDIFSRLNYAYTIIKDQDRDKYTQELKTQTEWVYLLLDEGEMGFHPDWQKRYVWLLHLVLPHIFQNMKLQILLTSHSPFVASDLPHQNIIFLNSKKEDFSINKKLQSTNTFAANIHVLLSDGFFLSNGLIGEFAKKKIQEVIDWLNDSRLEVDIEGKEIEEVKKIISLIGEPIIRNKLFDELNLKLGLDNEIDNIDREMERLQKSKEELIQKRNNAES